MMRAIIIGGGVAGLATAISLRQAGFDVKVYEKIPEYRVVGHGFNLLPNGIGALAQIGLAAQAQAAAHRIERVYKRTVSGQLLIDHAPSTAFCITRTHLINLLCAALPKDSLVMGMRFSHFDMDSQDKATAACFENDHTATGDIFIGADGIRSLTRQQLYPEQALAPTRVIELVGSAPIAALTRDMRHTFTEIVHEKGGVAFGIIPASSDKLIWYLQYDSERWLIEQETAAAKKAFALAMMKNWPSPIPAILEQSNFETAYVWRTADMDLLPNFHRGNVLLIGDAAHPMLTFTAQGMNSALEDAVVLADCLGSIGESNQPMNQSFKMFSALRRESLRQRLNSGRELAETFLHPHKVGAVTNSQTYRSMYQQKTSSRYPARSRADTYLGT